MGVTVDVAIASCLVLPEPDTDLEPLVADLRAAGVTTEVMGWDDPAAEERFCEARMVLLRSTWNYSERPAEFLAWVDRVAARTALHNGRETVRWNTHKSYLLDLDRRGVPVVPTVLLRRGETATLAETMREHGWSRVVVKPAVSGGSRETLRVDEGSVARGEDHLRALVAREDALVQPYQGSVEGHGERAMVWIDGELTHAVRKSPRFLGDAESVSAPVPIAPDEAEVARRALDAATALTGPVLYARIDVARDDAGNPRVMELELVEPSLFFAQAPAALARYVAAVRRRLAG
jgi:glutathione synthase/RimK-type ligase-like ATP-grasp enzyme